MPIKNNNEGNHPRFFKKSLGQNLLTDGNIARKIVSLLSVKPDDVILEIGPGLGALTDELASSPATIIAIEKDTRFAQELKERYKKPNLHIINEDALTFDYEKLFNQRNKKIKVVGNLPYNISAHIAFSLLELNKYFASFLFMFQKEVAKRITAAPSSKDYGILSVISQYYSAPKIVMNVPSSCFFPKPNVESAVARFDIYDTPPFKVRDEALFKLVVKTAFSHRRKTLANCFKGFNYNNFRDFDIEAIFNMAQIDKTKRGETLSVQDFARLTEKFHECCS